MNYLAHLYLADRAGADLAGAILGDFVRGADLSRFTPAVERSIRLHRRIDTLTDRHPQVQAAVARFDPGARRYAPIVLDVLLDHVLARDWAQYSSEPFASFCGRGAQAVAASAALFDGPRRPTRTGMATLLRSYATEPGIELALQRIATRLKQPQPMLDASRDWQAQVAPLHAELPTLLRDLETAARRFVAAADS